MGIATKISQNTFNELQTDAGVLLRSFNPLNPSISDGDIICATTGGINPVCTPTYSDWGDDVDNVPANMKELKHLDSWECTLGFTALNVTKESIRLSLGAADIDGDNDTKIVPRRNLKGTDFADIWWVGDRSDGGLVAVCLKNALSTSGFSLQTTKNGKGQIAVTLTGHISIEAQDTMPMEFYVLDGDDVPAVSSYALLIRSGDEGTSDNPLTETSLFSVVDDNGVAIDTISSVNANAVEGITVSVSSNQVSISGTVDGLVEVMSIVSGGDTIPVKNGLFHCTFAE